MPKIDGAALLVADPPQCNSTTRQNQPIWDSPVDIAITVKPILHEIWDVIIALNNMVKKTGLYIKLFIDESVSKIFWKSMTNSVNWLWSSRWLKLDLINISFVQTEEKKRIGSMCGMLIKLTFHLLLFYLIIGDFLITSNQKKNVGPKNVKCVIYQCVRETLNLSMCQVSHVRCCMSPVICVLMSSRYIA